MSPRSPQQNLAQREETRQGILTTALKAFAEKGYAATSISYIAKEAGISKGLTYHYFHSKEDLLHGIFQYLNSFNSEAIDQIKNTEPKEQLRLTVEMTFEYIQSKPDLMRFMTSLALQPDAMVFLREDLKQYKQQSIDVYTELFRSLNYSVPEAEAYYLGAMLDGVSLGSLALQEDYPLLAIKEKILNHYQL
jgi:AcrR family transcriptional regulator